MGFSSSTFVAAYGPSDHVIKLKDTAGTRVGGFHVCQYVKSAVEDKELWILTSLGKIILDFPTPQDAQAALSTIEVAVDALLPNCSDSGAPQPYIPLSGTTLTHALTGPIEYSTVTNNTSVLYDTSVSTTFAIGGGDNKDLLGTAVKAALIEFTGNATHTNVTLLAKTASGSSLLTLRENIFSLTLSNTSNSLAYGFTSAVGGFGIFAVDSTGAFVTRLNTTPTSIFLNSSNPVFAGATYAADYSANFTARSLIDKGYADLTYLTLASANFIPLAGTTAPLTGTVEFLPVGSGATALVNTQQNFLAGYYIGGGDNISLTASATYSRIFFDGQTPDMRLRTKTSGGSYSEIQLSGNTYHMITDDNAGISVTEVHTTSGYTVRLRNANQTNQQLQMQLDCSGYPFTFFVSQFGSNFQGIQYGFDYSADYTNRSLIDKGYADATYGTTKKAAITFTPGAINTPNTITHNLNTTDFTVQLWDLTTGAVILANIDTPTSTQVNITFSVNPAGNVKAVVIG